MFLQISKLLRINFPAKFSKQIIHDIYTREAERKMKKKLLS